MRTMHPWAVDIDTTKVGLEHCMRALIVTGSALTSSMTLGGVGWDRFGRGYTAFLRVQIPEGAEARVDSICLPIERRRASTVSALSPR